MRDRWMAFSSNVYIEVGDTKEGLFSLLTYFIHAVLVTRYLVCQGDTSVQVTLARLSHGLLGAFLYRGGSA